MESLRRRPFQGLINIVRFNWHFYLIALGLILFAFFFAEILIFPVNQITRAIAFVSIAGIVVSLFVSWYIYDHSGLYALSFLDETKISPLDKIVNVNAGFDETSAVLHQKFPLAELLVFDFYDPQKHTEISIERARRAYPRFPGTKTISTRWIPLKENSTKAIFLILAAHEIRNDEERVIFFSLLRNALQPDGKLIVVEHQRDASNFFAFNFGFFHFFSNASWKRTFAASGLLIEKEYGHTPFLTTFILRKNGTAS